jgi:epoxide hydrolase-like predicted phosphatase
MKRDTIGAVVFDFGGVLMRTLDPVPRAELGARFGLGPEGAEEIVFGNPLWDDVQVGRLARAEFWADAGRRLGLDSPGLEEFERLFWSGDRLDDELLGLVRHLRDNGYSTALLSNGPGDLAQYFDELGLVELFDVIVVSGLEGVMKPDPAIYELTLERLGVQAGRTVFIDDLLVNVEAAERLGLRAVRFEGVASLWKSLGEMGIELPQRPMKAIPGLRAVMFDWGGVMESPPRERFHAIEQRLQLGPGELAEALWGKVWRLLSVGAISEEVYNEHVRATARLDSTAQVDLMSEELYGGNRLHGEVLEAVRSLRGRYRLALVTNAWPGHADAVRERLELDLQEEFDVYVNSAWVGLRKPDPAIYRLALSELGVEPGEALLVDDLQRNLDSAGHLGIHTLQFVEPKTSLADLEVLLGHGFAERS